MTGGDSFIMDESADPPTSQLSANHVRRMAFLSLLTEQQELYDSIGYREKLDAVDEGIRR